ncbi:MAG: hypothetical protein ACRDHX_01600 [Chloroflexota bacterium]
MPELRDLTLPGNTVWHIDSPEVATGAQSTWLRVFPIESGRLAVSRQPDDQLTLDLYQNLDPLSLLSTPVSMMSIEAPVRERQSYYLRVKPLMEWSGTFMLHAWFAQVGP